MLRARAYQAREPAIAVPSGVPRRETARPVEPI